jgi:hypothetical protein
MGISDKYVVVAIEALALVKSGRLKSILEDNLRYRNRDYLIRYIVDAVHMRASKRMSK